MIRRGKPLLAIAPIAVGIMVTLSVVFQRAQEKVLPQTVKKQGWSLAQDFANTGNFYLLLDKKAELVNLSRSVASVEEVCFALFQDEQGTVCAGVTKDEEGRISEVPKEWKHIPVEPACLSSQSSGVEVLEFVIPIYMEEEKGNPDGEGTGEGRRPGEGTDSGWLIGAARLGISMELAAQRLGESKRTTLIVTILLVTGILTITVCIVIRKVRRLKRGQFSSALESGAPPYALINARMGSELELLGRSFFQMTKEAEEELLEIEEENCRFQEEKKEMARDVQNALSRVKMSISKSERAVVRLDRKGNILSFSPEAEGLFRIKAAAAIGKSFPLLFSSQEAGQVTEMIETAAQDQNIRCCEVERKSAADRLIHLSISFYPMVDAQGGIGEIVAECRNMTERRKAEEKFRLALVELKEFEKRKDRFYSSLPEKLKGPLASLQSFSSLISNYTEKDDSTKMEFLRIVNAERDRLSKLINDVLQQAQT